MCRYNNIRFVLQSLLFICFIVPGGNAANWWFDGSVNSNWHHSGNWTDFDGDGGPLPAGSEAVSIRGDWGPFNDPVIYDGLTANGAWIQVNTGASLTVGQGGSGAVLNSSGSGVGNIYVGNIGTGTLDVNSGVVHVGDNLYIGTDGTNEGTGIVNIINGGEINVGWQLLIAEGGTVSIEDGTLDVGSGGLDISGGVIDIRNNGRFRFGGYTESEAKVMLEQLTANDELIAYGGQGSIVQYYDSGTSQMVAEAVLPSPLDVTIDFESGDTSQFYRNSGVATYTTDPQKVLSGSTSLHINSNNPNWTWVECFRTQSAAIPIYGHQNYSISFRYRFLDMGTEEGTMMYLYARSLSGLISHTKEMPYKLTPSDEWQEIRWIMPSGPQDYVFSLYTNRRVSVVLDDFRVKLLPWLDERDPGMEVQDADYEPYGMCTHFDRLDSWPEAGFTDAEVLTSLDLLEDAGVQWIRTGAPWNSMEYYENYYHPSVLQRQDMIVDEAAARGIECYMSILGTPPWASTHPGETDYWAYGPVDLDDWADHVNFVGNRYKGKVTHWEIGNEIDWIFYKDQLETFVALLQVAYNELKVIDSNNTIIFAGLASDGVHYLPWLNAVTQYDTGAEEFSLQRLYDAGAKDYFDILSIHPYVDDVETGTTYSVNKINSVYEIMVKNGDGHKPLWITEIGYSTHLNPSSDYELQRQARYLETVYTELLNHPKVDKIFWWNFKCLGADSQHVNNFGIVNNDLTPRPAYWMYYNLIKSMTRYANYDFTDEIVWKDLFGDGEINAFDLSKLAEVWQSNTCSFPDWCDGGDLNRDQNVNLHDFRIFAQKWLQFY